jgi:Holliday junction resolvase RusA-like endonuclease
MQDFIIAHAPLPCPRPRIVVRGRFPSAYYPKPYTEWKAVVEQCLKAMLNEGRLLAVTGPLCVTIYNVATRPKSTKLAYPKPDVDNYAKSVMDAMTKAGLWEDDSQVVLLTSGKRWTEPTEAAHIRVTLQPLELA